MVPVGVLDLVDLRRVDVEVEDAARIGCEVGRISRDAIVEARGDGDEQVTVLDRVICECRPVHSQHVEAQRIRRIEASQAHERRDTGYAERFRKRP